MINVTTSQFVLFGVTVEMAQNSLTSKETHKRDFSVPCEMND